MVRFEVLWQISCEFAFSGKGKRVRLDNWRELKVHFNPDFDSWCQKYLTSWAPNSMQMSWKIVLSASANIYWGSEQGSQGAIDLLLIFDLCWFEKQPWNQHTHAHFTVYFYVLSVAKPEHFEPAKSAKRSCYGEFSPEGKPAVKNYHFSLSWTNLTHSEMIFFQNFGITTWSMLEIWRVQVPEAYPRPHLTWPSVQNQI